MAAHVLKPEPYREGQYGPCARMTRKFLRRSVFCALPHRPDTVCVLAPKETLFCQNYNAWHLMLNLWFFTIKDKARVTVNAVKLCRIDRRELGGAHKRVWVSVR